MLNSHSEAAQILSYVDIAITSHRHLFAAQGEEHGNSRITIDRPLRGVMFSVLTKGN
jgi:hypothetical protein